MATLKLTQDFREFLQLLNSEKSEYLLIGGYAVCLYGFPRPTKDIDIWVAVDPVNEAKLIAALVKFGFSPESVRPPLFSGDQTVLRVGLPPNRLELLSKIAGVTFDECYARRVVVEIEGLQVPVISYDDLLRNKRAAGRETDLADVGRLQQRRRKP